MGVLENLPCDCAALGTIAAIVGLAFNIYSQSEIELAGDTYKLTCGWDEAVYSVSGKTFEFYYSEYANLEEGEKCVASEAINSQDYEVEVCDEITFYVGIAYLVCGILGTLITTCSVMSQAPKFAAKSLVFLYFIWFIQIGAYHTHFIIANTQNIDTMI